jgi:hypothetical protein
MPEMLQRSDEGDARAFQEIPVVAQDRHVHGHFPDLRGKPTRELVKEF